MRWCFSLEFFKYQSVFVWDDWKVSSPCFSRFWMINRRWWSRSFVTCEVLFGFLRLVYEYYFTWRRRLYCLYQSTWSVECYGSEQWSKRYRILRKHWRICLFDFYIITSPGWGYLGNLHFIFILKPGLIGVFHVRGGGVVSYPSFPLGIILHSALYRLGRIPNLSEIDTVRLTLPIFLMIEGDTVLCLIMEEWIW